MTRSVVAVTALLVLVAPLAHAEDPFRALDLMKPSRATLAEDFTVRGLASARLRLSDFSGKVRLVNFWATWCPPCRTEMPAMERLYRRYTDRGFVILAISIDTDTAAVAPFVKRLKLTFPVGLDPDLVVANRYFVRALPTSFLIDRDGTMAALAMGARDWDETAGHAIVEVLLK